MSSNAERFGQIVKQRRTSLYLTQLEVSGAGGPSNTKQTEIEKGELEVLNPNMAKKLDKGLQWKPGSARTAWLGGEPTPLEASGPDMAERVAEIEKSNISESTKRWLIDKLLASRSPDLEPKAGESA